MEFFYLAVILALAALGAGIFWVRRNRSSSVNNAPQAPQGPQGPQGPDVIAHETEVNLGSLKKAQLAEYAKERGISGVDVSMRKSDMIKTISDQLK